MHRSDHSLKMSGVLLTTVIAALLSGCASLEPPDVNGPHSNVPPYPVIATGTGQSEEGLLAWRNLGQLYGLTTAQMEPRLNPLTGTLASLPTGAESQIVLPKVGAGPTQTEEEIRESLRRFIRDWKEPIGADPVQLSLVDRVDEPSGLKLAHYEQRPFRHPLRGGFGNLEIRFRSDRHVVSMSSNCIPHPERYQAALAALTPQVAWQEAGDHVKGHAITTKDQTGKEQTFTLPVNTPVEVQQLVIYAAPGKEASSLELHLAWEIAISNALIKMIYLDAVTDEVVGAK